MMDPEAEPTLATTQRWLPMFINNLIHRSFQAVPAAATYSPSYGSSTTLPLPEALIGLPLPLFDSLAAELIHHIASFLPIASAAAFSTCSHTIFAKLGTVYIVEARKHEETCLDFLDLLSKDIPDQILCFPCKKIHSVPDAAELPSKWFKKANPQSHPYKIPPLEMQNPKLRPYEGVAPCVMKDLNYQLFYFVHLSFSSAIFDMIM